MADLPLSMDGLIKAPTGTKLWLLHVGDLEVEEGFLTRGGNASTASEPQPHHKRRKLIIATMLISHPTEGLILFETGAGKDYDRTWGAPINDLFARVDHTPEKDLVPAIRKTGHDIKDVKMVIMGHLHLDHAGGLEEFVGTDTPIWCHEAELKHAFYSVATGSDLGVYLPHYLRFDLNWQTFHGASFEIAPGLMLRHSPGHTPGLCILQVNLPESGTWIFTTDQYHVKENYEASVPQGWLARDHDDWVRSNQMIHQLAKRTGARLVFGHCAETFAKYKTAPEYYT